MKSSGTHRLEAAGILWTTCEAIGESSSPEVLGLAGEIGTAPDRRRADICGLRWNPDALPHVDTSGATRPGGCWEAIFVVRAGEVVRTP